jgi:DNA invertase Pin-like site-specific DNA recombinase
VNRVNRIGRAGSALSLCRETPHALGIDLLLHQGLDITTPAGKALFQMGVFAEFERAMIQERVRARLARARSQGKRLGRPRIAPELKERMHYVVLALRVATGLPPCNRPRCTAQRI